MGPPYTRRRRSRRGNRRGAASGFPRLGEWRRLGLSLRSAPDERIRTMSDRMLALPLGAALALALAAPAGAVTLEWVAIGAPGNAPDVASNCNAASCGAVSHEYEIGRYEITNDQYAEFLNAVAADDPNGLYNPAMASDARGGIVRAGTPGTYTYSVKNGRGGDPVVFVSLWDAMRFANWLQNG